MTSFTNVFGGSAVNPSEVAYAAYSFSSSLTLFWPAFSAGNTDIAARFMNFTATNSGLNANMPDATLVSVGYDVIIFNAGSNTFNVVDFDGGAIATIAAGQTYYILLNDNMTQAGGWQTLQFGVGTGSASAAALAGYGLLASSGLLNANFPTVLISGSTALTSTSRAMLNVWTGGSGTISLPTASSVGNGFFFMVANQGSGSVTLSAGDNIDGASTSVFTQTQSAFVVASGGTWYTVGKGTQTNFAVTILNLNVAGAADITETSAQAQNIIQQFTGILTGNINVIMPNSAQIYFLYNDTSGAFTLTVKTSAGSGIAIDQGTHSIVYCDGTNIVNAFTSSFGGGISISPGSASSPNLNFIGSLTTGIFSPATDQLAVTAGGYEVMNFTSGASSVNYLQAQASATGDSVVIAALGSDTNIGINYTAKGTGSHNFLANGGAAQFVIGNVSSAVNQIKILGATTSNAPALQAIGSDTDIGISYLIQGAGVHAFTGAMTVSLGITANITGNLTGNITGTAPAGTLTGTTLASNVVTSSLTTVGTIGAGVWNGTAITGTYIASSVALAGNPTTTTPTLNDNSTLISTTAYYIGQATTKIIQQTASDATRFVNALHQQDHPSAVKAWVSAVWNGSNGYTLGQSYNVASIVRNSTGNITINFTTPFFASGAFAWSGSASVNVAASFYCALAEISRTAGSLTAIIQGFDNNTYDANTVNVIFFGTQ